MAFVLFSETPHIVLSRGLWCDTMYVVHLADDPFVYFGTKPDKGFGHEIRDLEEGTQRRSWRRGTQSGGLGSTPDILETSCMR